MISPPETASGQHKAWNLIEKLGEGDAGEVFRVESLIDGSRAILKRPHRKSFPSDVIRQAAQIEKEALVLNVLSRLNSSSGLTRVPVVKDISQPETGFSDRFFIVISHAPGFCLTQLSRLAHFQNALTEETSGFASLSLPERAFKENISLSGKIPDLILLRALRSAIEYLETIHTFQAETPKGKVYGVLWNDIKPEHFFWDPIEARFTLIDWGNAQFLEEDGITKDRQYSRMGDFLQLLSSMGRFFAEASPGLYRKLNWQENITPTNVYSNGVFPLKESLNNLLEEEIELLHQARQLEFDLIHNPNPGIDQIEKLRQLHKTIAEKGEMPNHQGAIDYYVQLARNLVANDDLNNFQMLCNQVSKMSALDAQFFLLIGKIAEVIQSENLPHNILLSGLERDWASTLWELCLSAINQPKPPWWDELSSQIQNQVSGSKYLRPLTALNRLLHSLQSVASDALDRTSYDELIQEISTSIIPRWTQQEPNPPDSGIDYAEIERLFKVAAGLVPEPTQALIQALDQPRAQVKIAIDAFSSQDFDSAKRALRSILLWDPDRSRLIQADYALNSVNAWLTQVRNGVLDNEPLQDFITRLELSGRELRNQIAPSPWMDDLLAAFKQLRYGEEPTDVLVQHPGLRNELGWLITLEPRRPLLASKEGEVNLERMKMPLPIRPTLYGIKESEVGKENGIILSDPLDTWAPEARGSSARLFTASLSVLGGNNQLAAVKLMRPDLIDYALPLFREETGILSLLYDVPGISPIIETGFLQLNQPYSPLDDQNTSPSALKGIAIRYGLDSTHNFLADLETKAEKGYLPYIAIEKYDRRDNLLLLCDTGYTNGHFLPTLDGLVMAIQICDILEAAHIRGIIYRDHKILHYYWLSKYNGIFMIDWNVSKRFPAGLSASDIQFDLVQFGARALHHILAGRSAPGALPLGPNRPEEIESAAVSYPVNWTYDDQRLPKDIKDVLQSVLSGDYNSARQLREDLYYIFQKLSGLVYKARG